MKIAYDRDHDLLTYTIELEEEPRGVGVFIGYLKRPMSCFCVGDGQLGIETQETQ